MDEFLRVLGSGSQGSIVTARHSCTGGVLPFFIDPSNGKAYFVFGLSKRQGQLCHFHGWIEQGESPVAGAAREAYEESRGVFGSQQRLFRALMDSRYHRPWYPAHIKNGIFASVFLGSMTLGQAQERIIGAFPTLPIYHSAMDEVTHLCPVEVTELRHWALSGVSGTAPVVMDSITGEGHCFRDFVVDWLQMHTKYAKTWHCDWMTSLASVPATTAVLPLTDWTTMADVNIPIGPSIPPYQWGLLGPQRGAVKFFNKEKGFGFLTVHHNEELKIDIFFAEHCWDAGDNVIFLCGWNGKKQLPFAFALQRQE